MLLHCVHPVWLPFHFVGQLEAHSLWVRGGRRGDPGCVHHHVFLAAYLGVQAGLEVVIFVAFMVVLGVLVYLSLPFFHVHGLSGRSYCM